MQQDQIPNATTDLDNLKQIARKTAEELKSKPSKTELENLRTALGDLVDSGHQRLNGEIADLEKAIEKLKTRQEKLEDNDSKQTTAIEELLGADRNIYVSIEKNSRQVDEIQSRLDGTRIAQIRESSLEAMRVQVNQNSEMLAGSGGQLPYREIQAKLQNTLFLGQVLKLLASLFGVGGILAAGSALIGVGKAPDLTPVIAEQKNKIENLETKNDELKGAIDKLENRLNRLTERQVTTTK